MERGEGRTNIISQENIRIVFARDRVDSMRTYDPCIVRFMRNALGLCHCRLPSPVADVIGSRGHALWSTLMIYDFQKISLGEVKGGGSFGGEGCSGLGGGNVEYHLPVSAWFGNVEAFFIRSTGWPFGGRPFREDKAGEEEGDDGEGQLHFFF